MAKRVESIQITMAKTSKGILYCMLHAPSADVPVASAGGLQVPLTLVFSWTSPSTGRAG